MFNISVLLLLLFCRWASHWWWTWWFEIHYKRTKVLLVSIACSFFLITLFVVHNYRFFLLHNVASWKPFYCGTTLRVRTYIFVPCGKFASTNQKHYPDLGTDASSVWNFCTPVSTSFCEETSGGIRKCLLRCGTVSFLFGMFLIFLYCFRRPVVVVVVEMW